MFNKLEQVKSDIIKYQRRLQTIKTEIDKIAEGRFDKYQTPRRIQSCKSKRQLFEIKYATVSSIIIQDHYTWAGGVKYPDDIPQIFCQQRLVGGKVITIDRSMNDNKVNNNELSDKSSSKFYSGMYIYGGPFYHHFGHALTESIHRLYAFDNNIHNGVVFAIVKSRSQVTSVNSYTPPGWFTQILEILNIDLSKCVFITENSIFENLIIPEPGSELSLGVKEWYRPYLRKLQQKILGSTKELRKNQTNLKLFLGRSHIIHQGGVAGEKYIEQLLVAEGFTSLVPERYSIYEQLSYLIASPKTIFTEGSSVYLLELLDTLKTDFMCISRRPSNLLFKPHIEGKVCNYITLGSKVGVIRLNHWRRGSQEPSSISVLKEPSCLLESIREEGFALLDNWDDQEFLYQEKYDITEYLNQGIRASQTSDRKQEILNNVMEIQRKYMEIRDLNRELISL